MPGVRANEPRKHHYVPVFYQKHFTDGEGLPWVYDRKLKTYKRLPPQVVCFENDFYTIFSKNGRHLRTIETEFTKPVDAIGATALQKLASRRALDMEVVHGLALHIGLQRTRVPSFRRAMAEVHKATAGELMRIGFSDVNRAAQLLARYQECTGAAVGETPEAMVEFVRSGAFTIKATEAAFLQHMIHQAETMSDVVSRYEWCILEAPPNSGFITCDDPLVTVPPSTHTGEGVGIAIPGSVTYFPLTRRFCLRVETPGRAIRFRKVGAHATRQVNKNVAANSDRFILGPDMPQLRLGL